MKLNEQIRQWFIEHREQYVSGEQLSRQFGVSRNAIWKQIQQLRKEGYIFEAIPNKGYKLQYTPAPLNISKMIGGLQTRTFGKKIHYFHQIDSTQTKALEIIEKGASEGEVVIAEMQTAGRGRMGRKWHSPPAKGIWMSIILTPSIPVHHISQLSLLVALAMCRAIRRIGIEEVGIKWPNDLLVRGKKVSGVLLESASEDERLRYVIVGIGISVNLQLSDYPLDMQPIATSLAIELGRDVDREQLFLLCLEELEDLYHLYMENGFKPIQSSWEALSVSLHRPIRIQQGLEVIEGVAESLDDSGGLVVRKSSGEQIIVYSGLLEHN
jgi:BirA family biotin operon repressor/biotin-[acetyl-CoA-carboxylase] ligase